MKTNSAIPHMFYVRCTRKGPVRNLYTFWDYRRRNQGCIESFSRILAKRTITRLFPNADFYR